VLTYQSQVYSVALHRSTLAALLQKLRCCNILHQQTHAQLPCVRAELLLNGTKLIVRIMHTCTLCVYRCFVVVQDL